MRCCARSRPQKIYFSNAVFYLDQNPKPAPLSGDVYKDWVMNEMNTSKDWVMNEMNTSPHGPFNCLDF